MPPRAQVIIFDDDGVRRKYLGASLRDNGHVVIGEAGSVQELEKMLPSLTVNPSLPIVALIDNNAPWKPNEGVDPNGVGYSVERKVIDFFEATGLHPITIAVTLSKDPQYGDHYYSPRDGTDIGPFVTALPRKER